MPNGEAWWRSAAIYQIYPRSFADGNGDGVGDLPGIRARLDYLSALGVDGVWLSPWYVSPMADAGYDVADYRDIDPVFGTLADAEALIAELHTRGLRLIIDLVPNHCSVAHPWFQAALAGSPDARARFHFRSGRGPAGDEPPNDWTSSFGGPAWTRLPTGEWYLHLFTPEQPDFNWDHPAVRAEFESILRFWMDRGVDGIRIDVAHALVKQDGLPDRFPGGIEAVRRPDEDRPEVHEIYRSWRRLLDSYTDRALVGEVWVPNAESLARYLRPDELHSAFNFAFLSCPWDGAAMRAVIDETLAAHAPAGAAPTWVLTNHDVTRHVTRYGRTDSGYQWGARQHGAPVDLTLGTRRARAAALLTMALPGSVYVYQGDELGLPEVSDLPDEARQDPVWVRSGYTDRGRDGCRIPLPWGGSAPPYEFGPAGTTPWLPQPDGWKHLTADRQSGDAGSMLTLYRTALRLRRATAGFGDGPIEWQAASADVLWFSRGHGLTCVVNLGPTPVPVPAGYRVLLTSDPLVEPAVTSLGSIGPEPIVSRHLVPRPFVAPDTAVWLVADA